MKEQLFENYNEITKIRSSIHERIESDNVKEYLLLVIKWQFLESQNIQLLLNLQLQAKTISKYDKYFTKISENGGIPMECFDAMDDDDDLDKFDQQAAYSEDIEEEKVDNADELQTSQGNNQTSGEGNEIADSKDPNNLSKIPRVGKSANQKKASLVNNPYMKKNPYLVQQSKKRKK